MSIEKKYLNLDGLKTYTTNVKKLLDKKIDKPAGSGNLNAPLGAYKIRTDANGFVVETVKLELSDLGIESPMRFVGVSSTDPTGSSGATIEGYAEFKAGDVCLYKDTTKEYIYDGKNKKWLLLGDEGSYALNTVNIKAGNGLSGGGTLKDKEITIAHKTTGTTALTDFGVYAIKTDEFGHVTETKGINTDVGNAGNHTHSFSGSGQVTVPKVSATSNKKLSVSATKDNFLVGVTPTKAKLVTTSIKPAVAVDETNRPTKTVYSTVKASKATASTPITYAKKAETSTNVGNADVGATGKVNVTALNPESESETKNVYDVYYNSGAECLEFTAVILKTDIITQAAASEKYIYGVKDSEAEFTPYTFTDVDVSNITANTAVDVATVGTDIEVATGRLAAGAAGDQLMTNIDTTTAQAVTSASIDDTQTTGVAFVSGITISSEEKTVSVSGDTSEAGTHTHTVTLS